MFLPSVRGVLRASLLTAAPLALAAACADAPVSTPAPAHAVAAVPLTQPGVAPRLFRAGNLPARPAATPAASALAHVGALAPAWGAPRGTADLAALATVPVRGGDVVRIRQSVDGVPIAGGELRVMVGPGGTLVAASGTLVGADVPRDRTGFQLDPATAVARAVGAVHGRAVATSALTPAQGASEAADPASWFAGTAPGLLIEEARARKAWYRSTTPREALAAAWIVEAYTSLPGSTDSQLDRVVIGARDGRILERRNLTVDDFNYRVWAETTGERRPLDGPGVDNTPHITGVPGADRPGYVAPSLVSFDGLATGSGVDPWLPAGATETAGNNVDAYTDINSPGGLTAGDFRASVTAAGTFDRIYDVAADPLVSQGQQMAAITQLFYSINWLHDYWYKAGLTEITGNAQADNYGRGGIDGDRMRAEAQDSANDGRRNNANMSTPADGMSPRMQVYLWSGPETSTLAFSPSGRTPATNGASFGPDDYDVTGTVVAGTDGTGTNPLDGCEALTNNVSGQVALVDRGNCSFKRKALNAQNAGAIGVIIADNIVQSQPPGLGNDSQIADTITIPAMAVTLSEGTSLRSDLMAGPVTAHLQRVVEPEADGSLDAALVAHEFGHYIHHRLSECGTSQCGAMSEGWGDFFALHLMLREGDDLDGAYGVSGYAYAGDPYFGIRRVPYSVDTSKNAFTFGMVSDDAGLPSSHPLSNNGIRNSEVHNAGEVWATALFEGYVALHKASGSFEDARQRMADYVVAGLLMAPPDATFTEVRDAILTAAQAGSQADFDTLMAAFARRGLGSCAKSPDRGSRDFTDALENFDVKGQVVASTPTVTVDVQDCDADGFIDVGDTATVTLSVANRGVLPLSAVTLTAVGTPGLTVIGAPVELGGLTPGQATTATVQVRLDQASGPEAGTLDLTVASSDACNPSQVVSVPLRLNLDVRPAASASDSFDAPSVWAATGDDAALVWSQEVDSGLDRSWRGADLAAPVDVALESPPLVAGTGAVVIEFDHRFDFEESQGTLWDGGVIELTTDGGSSWVDVATLVDPGYSGVLTDQSGNPLGNRNGFGGQNPSYPANDHVTLDLGTALAGQTFQLRFRIGTDASVGATGWAIDDLVVTGITNTPFPVQDVDAGSCAGGPDGGTDPGEGGGCCSTGGPRGSDVAAGLLVLAALGFRRRRRRV